MFPTGVGVTCDAVASSFVLVSSGEGVKTAREANLPSLYRAGMLRFRASPTVELHGLRRRGLDQRRYERRV